MKAKPHSGFAFFMNKLLLRLALLPAGLWRKAGADVGQLQAILGVKLKMDDRKPLNFGRQQAKKKNRRFSSIIGVLVSFFTGMIYILPLIRFEQERMLGLSLFFTMFLFLLTFTLITDFSNVLIDTRDKLIVLPRPVSDRTLTASRILHIGIYLFRIVLPMSLPGWITLGILDGWRAVLWFPLPLLLLMFTALFLVTGIYMLILRVASAARFKDIISYFQIAFSITIFAFYYLVPKATDSSRIAHAKLADFPWAKYFPSYWLAATWSWIHPHSVPANTIYYSIPALLLPILLLAVTLKYLAPQFAANLGGLDSVDGEGAGSTAKKAGPNKLQNRLATLLNHRPEAQAGFLMTWLQTARSRPFKLKIYPLFAYVPIYFIYLLSLSDEASFTATWHSLAGTGRHIILLYMSSLVVLQALGLGTESEHYKASWVYYAVPLSEPGALMAGAFKAMWVKYLLPFFMVISIFVLSIWGASSLLDIVLALVNVTLFAVCTVRIAYRRFPFSQAGQVSNAGSKFLRGIISLAIPGTLGAGHYFAIHVWWLKVLYLALSAILLWLVWDSYAHTTWAEVTKEEV